MFEQAFRFTYGLGWLVLKDLVEALSEKTHGPRETIRLTLVPTKIPVKQYSSIFLHKPY